MLSRKIDRIRLEINTSLKNKNEFAQFMTPSVTANYMTSLFNRGGKSLLDCGAGIGSLTIAALTKIPTLEQLDCWEIDPIMAEHLVSNTQYYNVNVYCSDFIQDAIKLINENSISYDYIITNPPYKKINSNSKARKLLKDLGIRTTNLYSAFLSLSILLLKENGQLVAIIPRSFCNGAYYKEFREFILKNCSIDYIHLFESRNSLFSDDKVLQENIIIKLTRGKQANKVIICHSYNDDFSKMKRINLDFSEIILPNDRSKFIRIPKNHTTTIFPFKENINNLGISVSTGQIVDFRVKEYLQKDLSKNSYPLIYPHHFENGKFLLPKKNKKPNAILNDNRVKKWLLPNKGCYVVVNRFSPKENKKRIIANIILPSDIDKEFLAIENHLNFFHFNKTGIDSTLANGLLCYLKSSILDDFLRIFSGHTQINVGDLKSIPYPRKIELLKLGSKYKQGMLQSEIDVLIDEVISHGKETNKNK